jgi:hypothetical protein
VTKSWSRQAGRLSDTSLHDFSRQLLLDPPIWEREADKESTVRIDNAPEMGTILHTLDTESWSGNVTERVERAEASRKTVIEEETDQERRQEALHNILSSRPLAGVSSEQPAQTHSTEENDSLTEPGTLLEQLPVGSTRQVEAMYSSEDRRTNWQSVSRPAVDKFSKWTWSESHQNYYYTSHNTEGNVEYHWAPQQYEGFTTQNSSKARPESNTRSPVYHNDSGLDSGGPPSAPPEVFSQYPDIIRGTPTRETHESLDPSYRMRTGREAHEFYTVGRVFAMLWAEAASEAALRQKTEREATVRSFVRNDPLTPGRFGELVYSQIRRFVVVQVRRKDQFVKAW